MNMNFRVNTLPLSMGWTSNSRAKCGHKYWSNYGHESGPWSGHASVAGYGARAGFGAWSTGYWWADL